MVNFNCPNCGNQVEQRLSLVKMVTCDACGTSLFLADDKALTAGQGGDMHDAPLLFGIGDTVSMGRYTVDLLGHARYSYGRGFWDEFWGVDGQGNPVWVSVDEGDIVVQVPLPAKGGPKVAGAPRLGQQVDYQRRVFRIQEMESAECVAIRGSFGEPMEVGDTHTFVNAENTGGELLSGEFWDGSETWYLGEWFDPFEVRVVTGT